MTLQEIFDKVGVHLLTQNEQAMARDEDGERNCAYRAEGDRGMLKCAVGCLIPDELYTPVIEGFGVMPEMGSSNNSVAESRRLYSILEQLELDEPPQLRLLEQLQKLHDDFMPHQWRGALKDVAFNWRL